MTDFRLPELGENVTSGDVLRVLVKPGDTLEKDQPVVELETDKATIEVPSSVAGQVKEVKVKAGDKVKVGQAILSVEDGASAAKPSAATAPARESAPEQKRAPARAADTGSAKASGDDAVRANTIAKAPADGGLEQRVEGATRAAEEPERPVTRAQNVVDINRGSRAPAE